jgi:hypothetical protein
MLSFIYAKVKNISQFHHAFSMRKGGRFATQNLQQAYAVATE